MADYDAADDDPSSTSISLPSLAVLAALLFVLARYVLRSSSTSSPSSSSTSRSRAAQYANVDRTRVAQVATMFPQLDRRAIAWDLSRNGGSVARTAERVLASGGTLDRPPPSFQPPNLDEPSTSTAAASGTSTGASTGTTSRAQQDLIARYNLAGKLAKQPAVEVAAEAEREPVPAPAQKSTGWATTKTERASLLAARRDAMILKARRDMEARVLAERQQEGGTGKGKEREMLD